MPRRPTSNVRSRHRRWQAEIKRRGFADEVPQLDAVELMEWAYRAAQRIYVGKIREKEMPRGDGKRFIQRSQSELKI